MKNMMWKNPILSRNFRRGQESIKGSFTSNVLTMEKLGTFNPSVLIPRNTLRMNMTRVNNTRKKENLTIRKNKNGTTIQKKKKKTIVHLRQVIVMMRSYF